MNMKTISAIALAGCLTLGMLSGCSVFNFNQQNDTSTASSDQNASQTQDAQPEDSQASDTSSDASADDSITIGQVNDNVLSVSVQNKLGSDISSVSIKRESDSSYSTPLTMSATWANDKDATIYFAGVAKKNNGSNNQDSSDSSDGQTVYDRAGANAVIFNSGQTSSSTSSGNGSYSIGSSSTSTSTTSQAPLYDMQITTTAGQQYEITQINFENMRDGEVHLSDNDVAYMSYIDTTVNRIVSTIPFNQTSQVPSTDEESSGSTEYEAPAQSQSIEQSPSASSQYESSSSSNTNTYSSPSSDTYSSTGSTSGSTGSSSSTGSSTSGTSGSAGTGSQSTSGSSTSGSGSAGTSSSGTSSSAGQSTGSQSSGGTSNSLN